MTPTKLRDAARPGDRVTVLGQSIVGVVLRVNTRTTIPVATVEWPPFRPGARPSVGRHSITTLRVVGFK